ncbi:MAG: hypothetical protein PHR47_03765 [Candidatus Pacebacteria bacterium]|nr:hypothetical protein [Candidatus Paceibacterota bacterium]
MTIQITLSGAKISESMIISKQGIACREEASTARIIAETQKTLGDYYTSTEGYQ